MSRKKNNEIGALGPGTLSPSDLAEQLAEQLAEWWWTEGVNKSDYIRLWIDNDYPAQVISLELTDGDFDYIAQEWNAYYGAQRRSGKEEGTGDRGVDIAKKYKITKKANEFFIEMVARAARPVERTEAARRRGALTNSRSKGHKKSLEAFGLPSVLQRSGLPLGIDASSVEESLSKNRTDDDEVMGIFREKMRKKKEVSEVAGRFSAVTIPLSADDSRWRSSEKRVINGFKGFLSRRSQYLYAADVAERVFPATGKDLRVLDAIEAARAYALGQIGENEIKKARTAANALWLEIQRNPNRSSDMTLAYEAARCATSALNIAENYLLGDWQLPLLIEYIQHEAANAQLRAVSRELPEMDGPEELIATALIVREQCADLLDRVRPLIYGHHLLALFSEMQTDLYEQTDPSFWLGATLRLPKTATERLIYNRLMSASVLISELRNYSVAQDPLTLAENMALDKIQSQWDAVERHLSSIKYKQRLPVNHRRVSGLESWLTQVRSKKRLMGDVDYAPPVFVVAVEPPRRGELQPVLSLWVEDLDAPGKGSRIALIDEALIFMR